VNIKKAETMQRERKNIEQLEKAINILHGEIDRLKGDKSILEVFEGNATETEKALLYAWDYVRRVQASLEQHKIN
jgi:hypothetical protein